MNYQDFLKRKKFNQIEIGFNATKLNKNLWLHQPDIVRWACKRGRSAIFADTGLGKTLMQLEWANQVSQHTNKPVLLFAPLAVGKQTENEARKFNIQSSAKYMREFDSVTRIVITNYEMIDNFNPSDFSGIVLDESSILKGQNSAYRKKLTEFASSIPYRLSCTATPSPNDYMELGTQVEFLGIMTQIEMLSMFFIHDGSETQKWRLKGHGANKFWDWMATWAVVISSPADLGHDASSYNLPPLNISETIIQCETNGSLFAESAQGLTGARQAKKRSLHDRVKQCADWVNSLDDNESCIIWAETNEEGDLLTKLINNAVQVAGSDKIEVKEDRLLGFSSGKYKRLVTKSKIAGFGMNYQNACKMAFAATTYSFEQFYQNVRRMWRFGQLKQVDVVVFMSEEETAIHAAMMRKLEQDKTMRREMVKVMANAMHQQILGAKKENTDYKPTVKISMPSFI